MPLTQVQGGMILPSTTLTTPIVATTMGVGGATPAASGSGITFPATQSASTDANTLDDYEEGTWTPTIQGGTTAGTASYTDQRGWYTKIGNIVSVGFYVQYNSATGTGPQRIANLPFASGASATYYVTGSIMTGSIDWPGGTMITLYKPPGTTHFELYCSGDNIGWIQQTIDSAGEFMGACTYQV